MIINLLEWFTQLFRNQYQSQLDQFISSQNPVDVAHVEHLEREYSRTQARGFL